VNWRGRKRIACISIPKREKGKKMGTKHFIEHFQLAPLANRVALMVFRSVIVVLVIAYSVAGVSIIAFLVALKMPTTY